jgi:hypothetical protein
MAIVSSSMSTPAPSTIDTARCRECGYALRALTEPRCPECGTTFDPADPRTMRTPDGAPSWLRRIARPMTSGTHRLAAAALIGCGVLVLWGEAALPGGRVLSILALPVLLASFLAVLLHRSLVRLADRRYAIASPPQRSLAAHAAIALILAAIGISGLPRFVIFEWPYGPMHRTLVDLYAIRPAVETDRMDEWHGPWRLRRPIARWWRCGFHVALGEGFAASVADAPDGSIGVEVYCTWDSRR